MSDIKWVTISVMTLFLWVDVFVLWIAYTNPLNRRCTHFYIYSTIHWYIQAAHL